MSVASEISKLNTNISNAYDEIAIKNGIIPQNKNTDNLATAISSIPAGTPQVTDSRILITEYTPSTGVIKGQNFGSSGKVYLLDRDTHTYNELSTSSYSDTQVTLSSPIDTTNIVGTTCFYVAPTGKDISNKQMVYGDLPVPKCGILYLQEDISNPTNIRKIEIENSNELFYIRTGSAYTYAQQVTITNGTFYTNYIVGFQFGSQITSANIGSYCFTNCYKFNQPLYIPNSVTLGTYFLYQVYNFDSPIIFENNSNAIPDNFLRSNTCFNQPLDLSVINGNIGSHFLDSAFIFNQKIKLPENKTIGSYFLNFAQNFNQPLDISKIANTSLTFFMNNCYKFNQPIELPNTITTLNYFLTSCREYNQETNIPRGITSLGDSFLSMCLAFNKSISLPDTLTTIGSSFLSSLTYYNLPITIPSSVTSIGTSFMSDLKKFNSSITFEGTSISVGNNFLSQSYNFLQPLSTEKFSSIGNYFMQNCVSYSQPLTFNANSYGTYFLQNCHNINTLTWNSTATPTDNNSLAMNNTSIAYKKGVIVYGPHRTDLMTALPNITSYPYRNLIDGGS